MTDTLTPVGKDFNPDTELEGSFAEQRKNRKSTAFTSQLEEFYNNCHNPDTGEFCEDPHPDAGVERHTAKVTAKYKTRSEEWAKSLTDDEKKAVNEWAYSRFKEVNRLAIQDPENPLIKNLDSAIAKAPPLDNPTKVYRGVAFDKAETRDKILSKIAVGKEISISKPGEYQATSVTDRYPIAMTASWDIVYEVVAKNGAPIGVLGPPGEEELLIGRKEKFRVKSIQRNVKYRTASGKIESRDTVQVEQI